MLFYMFDEVRLIPRLLEVEVIEVCLKLWLFPLRQFLSYIKLFNVGCVTGLWYPDVMCLLPTAVTEQVVALGNDSADPYLLLSYWPV